MPARSLLTLLHGLVDYAGLYPPAKLGMAAAVDNYATYLHSRESWMLGRFICPVSRLEEFRREAKALLPTTEIVLPPATEAARGAGSGGGERRRDSSSARCAAWRTPRRCPRRDRHQSVGIALGGCPRSSTATWKDRHAYAPLGERGYPEQDTAEMQRPQSLDDRSVAR